MATFAESGGSSEGIKLLYIIYDFRDNDPYNIICYVLNKESSDRKVLKISAAAAASARKPLFLNFTAVAVGSTVYMIGGCCPPCGLCPDEVDDGIWHPHAEVRYFNALRPEEGWKEAARMHIARVKPSAVVVDGKIYVFGGSEEPFEYGEYFDPSTNKWECFLAVGCEPSFACIQVPYVDSNGGKGLLVHSDWRRQNEETLFSYTLGSQKWEVVSHEFGKCHRPGAILDGIIYALFEREEQQPLHGYHIMYKKWFPVEFDVGAKIHLPTAWVFPSGSDKLCLVWHHLDLHGKGEVDRMEMECLELRLEKSYTESGIMLKLTASKESHTCFRVDPYFHRLSIIAL